MWNFVLSSTLMRNNYKHKGIWFEFYFARYISPFSNLQDYTLRPCEDTKSSGENQKELFWRIKKICQLFDFTCENGNGKKKGRKHLISNLPKYKFCCHKISCQCLLFHSHTHLMCSTALHIFPFFILPVMRKQESEQNTIFLTLPIFSLLFVFTSFPLPSHM